MRERWKSIPGYEGLYEVSDCGRVRSLQRTVSNGPGKHKTLSGCVLQPQLDGSNKTQRLKVTLSSDGRVCQRKVHELVLTAFVGACPKDKECCHKDDNPHNNYLGNLRWGTRKENRADAIRNGKLCRGKARSLLTRGVSNGRAKLTDAEAIVIRKSKRTLRYLSDKYGVSFATISSIRTGRSWRHLAADA